MYFLFVKSAFFPAQNVPKSMATRVSLQTHWEFTAIPKPSREDLGKRYEEERRKERMSYILATSNFLITDQIDNNNSTSKQVGECGISDVNYDQLYQ